MKRFLFQSCVFALPVILLGWVLAVPFASVVLAQQPSETPTPPAETTSGMYITVKLDGEPQINVRQGPSSLAYPIVGTLPLGATAPALGRSPGGDWVQIQFDSAPDGKGKEEGDPPPGQKSRQRSGGQG